MELAGNRDSDPCDADEILLAPHLRKVVEGLNASAFKPGLNATRQLELCDKGDKVGCEPSGPCVDRLWCKSAIRS